MRAPGKNPYTSPRRENDQAEILSGIFEGMTTGAPISIMIRNEDQDSSKYESIKHMLRPGHANYTYLEKYGVFDYRGGGRASARETACRVVAGAVAKKLLSHYGIEVLAYIKQIGEISAHIENPKKEHIRSSPIFCPQAESAMIALLNEVKQKGDSLGGIVEFMATGAPAGLGEPVYEKLEAKLAYAMLSIPASKGFEIGSGFNAATMPGSKHNDSFTLVDGNVQTETNHAGGILGGISTGMPIVGRVCFKPPASIMLPQESVTLTKEKTTFELPEGSRHDPCVAIRAVPIVEAMLALVIADCLLLNRSSRLC